MGLELESMKKLIPVQVWDYTPIMVFGLGGLLIVSKVVNKIVCGISRRRMLVRWASTPKDMVIVHRFKSAKTCPNASPFVIKLETYLRMAKIPYETDDKDYLSVKGKSPWISLNGEHIADSQLCIEYLAKKFGKKIGNYSKEERAIAAMARITMDEHFYWGLLLWRYVYTKGRDCYKFFDYPKLILTLGIRFLLSGKIESACWVQGTGRHSKEEVIKIMCDDLRVLSALLGKKKFLLGNEACEDDAAVFGELAEIVWCCPDSPYEKLINEELTNLKEYCFRMKTTFWPDWDNCLSPSKQMNKND